MNIFEYASAHPVWTLVYLVVLCVFIGEALKR